MNDLFTIKEISKIFNSKEELIDDLKKFNYIKLSSDNETGSYVIDDNFSVFSMINIPQKMNRAEIIQSFGLDATKILRLYKKSLFWILTTDSTNLVKQIEEILKDYKFVRY